MGFWSKAASIAGGTGLGGLFDDERSQMAEQARGSFQQEINPLLASLRAQSQGQNSLVDEQAKQAMAKNIAAEQAMGATGRGSQALQQRQASQNIGGLRAGLAQQQTMAGAQERMMANQQLAQLLAKLRGQDIGLAGTLMQQPTSTERMMGMGQGVGQMAMMSDERVKRDIKPADDKAEALLDSLKAYSYDYKDPKHGKGRQLGVMAQDLERTLPQAVMDTPEGKAVDGGKLAGALAAASASMHARLKKLEGKAA